MPCKYNKISRGEKPHIFLNQLKSIPEFLYDYMWCTTVICLYICSTLPISTQHMYIIVVHELLDIYNNILIV